MLTAIDLFCGAGGLSYGFELAGFKVVAAVDNDPVVCETYRLQNPEIPLISEDIQAISGRRLKRISGGQVDLIIGGPSCQGFSTHGKRDPNDPRNFLFKQFVRIVNEVRPSWVVMENVKGLLTYNGGWYRKEIHKDFENIGYRIESNVLHAVDYGVPQLRERLFFVATRTSRKITFPRPTHCRPEVSQLTKLKPYVTVQDALGDLPDLGDEGEMKQYSSLAQTNFQRYARRWAPQVLSLHRAKRVSDFAMKIIKYVQQGNGIRSLPEHRLPPRFKKMRKISNGSLRKDCTTLYYRLNRDKPSYTITCYFTNVSSGPFVHPSQNRAITPREAARLQSFPDHYKFSNRQVQRQIGNAVPPLLARAVAREVKKQMSIKPPKEKCREEAINVFK